MNGIDFVSQDTILSIRDEEGCGSEHLSNGKSRIVLNISGYIGKRNEQEKLCSMLSKERRYSLRNVPYDFFKEQFIIRKTCLGYCDSLTGLGKWANTRKINVVGEVNTHKVNGNGIISDFEYFANKFHSLSLDVDVGADDGSLDCQFSLKIRNGKVYVYPPMVDKISWFFQYESLDGLNADPKNKQKFKRRRVRK